MAPCNPGDLSLNPGPFPGTPLPGFGIPLAPIQFPLPELFDGFPEDLLELIDSLKIPWPGNLELAPNLDDLTNSILKALSSLFNQIAPFLGLYRFLQAALNMILCLLEILCAFPNPFKMHRAMRRLFKRCLPNFLSLLPWLALLAMILALLQMILALIEYIINKILQLIRDLIENLQTLGRGLSVQDDDSVTAAARKIASLLCLMENLIAVIVAIAAILAIIQALAGIQGRSACGGGRGMPTAGDDVNCCDDEVCPPFIAENPNGLQGLEGQLVYYREIQTDIESILGISSSFASQFNLSALRPESWQFVDEKTNQEYSFADIITPIGDGDIFFPEGVTFDKDTKPRRSPYTLDLTLRDFDPSLFHEDDVGGARTFKIKDIILTKKPYIGLRNEKNQLELTNTTGTLSLAGGLVFEQFNEGSDGVPYTIDGEQATLETFLHFNSVRSNLPSIDDGYYVSNVEFTLNIRHEVLIDYGLITLGCHPDLFQERFVANSRVESVGFDAIAVRLPDVSEAGFLPDALGAHACAATAIQNFRQDVSPENAENFQAEIVACLEKFRQETLDAFCNILKAGVSVFESTVEIDNNLQFITRPIVAKVVLKDTNGTTISGNIPENCADGIAGLIDGYVSLGTLSDFVYDGYESFTANITSDEAGSGILTVMFDNNTFKNILNSDNDNATSVIVDNTINYTFVGVGETDAGVRRDESDVARDGTD